MDQIARIVIDANAEVDNVWYIDESEIVDVKTGFFANAAARVLSRGKVRIRGNRTFKELSRNCTDFHSYFIALCRAVNIPARFAIGAAIPSERNEGGIDGYHCWAEFYTDGRWWPVDISEGDKCSSLSTYYFGHHPANRIELSRGRDLVLEPGPASGPINFLAYPVLEINGEPTKVKVDFSFNRNTSIHRNSVLPSSSHSELIGT